MDKTSSNQLDSDPPRNPPSNSGKGFNRFSPPESPSKLKHQRIRLELNASEPLKQKGHIETHFLLREEQEEGEESHDAIRTKRQLFRELFEAVLKR